MFLHLSVILFTGEVSVHAAGLCHGDPHPLSLYSNVRAVRILLEYILVTISLFLPPATKLGQGYIFTGVCDSVHGGCACSQGGVWSGGVPGGDPPPGRLLLRAVRILLECILVLKCFEDISLFLWGH